MTLAHTHMRMPNPSLAPAAEEKPTPSERTNGTVTSPVVVAENQGSGRTRVKTKHEREVRRVEDMQLEGNQGCNTQLI